jgi:hypothetical protein
MPSKPYKNPENTPLIVSEPAVAYQRTVAETSYSNEWNPNIPVHAMQEEWWEYFHRIEEGLFHPASETHQRILQWLYNQKT